MGAYGKPKHPYRASHQGGHRSHSRHVSAKSRHTDRGSGGSGCVVVAIAGAMSIVVLVTSITAVIVL